MKHAFSRLAIATGAIGLAAAPIAVQANTRAGNGGVINASESGTTSDPWIYKKRKKGGFLDGSGGILAIVFGGLAIGGLLVVLGDNDDQSPPRFQSPGAN